MCVIKMVVNEGPALPPSVSVQLICSHDYDVLTNDCVQIKRFF